MSLSILVCLAIGRQKAAPIQTQEVRRYTVAEAHQSVAVDKTSFYAIDNAAIGRYDKATGQKLGLWKEKEGRPIKHLNSGIVIGNRLYCANSNYPDVPMASSIEIFDIRTMELVGTHSFGIFMGSATWIDYREGSWWVCFAHYKGKNNDEPTRDPRWTSLIRFDKSWRQTEGWIFPAEVVSHFGNYSCSGGVFGSDGRLFATGHDNAECFVLRIPKSGPVLELEQIFAIPNQGQGIALDPADRSLLYGIDRKTHEVIVSRMSTTR